MSGKVKLHLYNTLTRQKVRFDPLDDSNIRMYVCGPTVYDKIHVGNARPIIIFDVLYRLLRTLYSKVTYVRNITDDLIRNELVHVIASDCHSPKGPRSPSLSAGLEAAVALVGWERAQEMVVDVPRAIVQGDLVTVANPRLIQPINR